MIARVRTGHTSATNSRCRRCALDLNDVLGELRVATELQAAAPPGTTIGHVHLQVADIAEAEAFYHGVLGFDVSASGYPGALFVSAGGYHHHIGLNTWHSAGASRAAPGSVGLRSFTIDLPDQEQLAAVLARIDAASIPSTAGSGRRARERPVRQRRDSRARQNGRSSLGPRAHRRERTRVATPTSAAATWRSGYAAACKAVYTGSIPVVALPD